MVGSGDCCACVGGIAMGGRRFGSEAISLPCSFAAYAVLPLLLLFHVGRSTAQTPRSHPSTPSPWQTLSGNAPIVIARGGFSGLFPDSSDPSYTFTYQAGSLDTVSLCDVQLTKDGFGICLPDITLKNSTNIDFFYPKGQKTYDVNGEPTEGWFSIDYNMNDLLNVSLNQGIFSRSNCFDGIYPILLVEDVLKKIKPAPLWLNIQHDTFYSQHKLSMKTYLLSLSRRVTVSYVSSPEVAFLSSVVGRLKGSKTKLIFCFLGKDTVEPSTKQTYGSLLKNLTFIKTFASGVLLPKQYIWPETSDHYLQPHSSVVLDAHKEGLEVYASGFANDALFSYNYSYDPLAEYLSFIDNGIFSVDGLLTDFPTTASEATGCFSHIYMNNSAHGNPLVISHNGASGLYPDCTDLAYQQAVKDGADYIDCPVQVTQDGVFICLSSINLMDVTTVATSLFNSHPTVIPEIQGGPGIFTFNLTWEQIKKNLKPTISSPDEKYNLYRNPLFKNAGKFVNLTSFLAFARDKALSGVVISIENAAFLAERLGYSVTDGVISALKDSGYNNQIGLEVMIQSTNSSILKKFKELTSYKLVYMIDESISDADSSSIANIKQLAHSVAINKQSIFPIDRLYTTGQTKLVEKLHSAGLSVYVYVLRNEFESQPWDFFSDPIAEINTYVQGVNVDGIITDFPGTAAAYKRNSCLKLGDKAPNYMMPIQVGSLYDFIDAPMRPPALPPSPVLDVSDVVEPPLPPVKSLTPPGENAPSLQPSEGPRCFPFLVYLIMISGYLLSI